MHRFYVNEEQIIDNKFIITGSDVNHIKNVLRMKPGDKIVICNGQGKDCYCIIKRVCDLAIEGEVTSVIDSDTELPVKITLFQGIPKTDKMELIIQKAVELGVHEVVPVMMARCVVKYSDSKKEEKKIIRWQSISESAAKQSRRGIIPKIHPILSYKDAIAYAGKMNMSLLAFENERGMQATKEVLNRLKNCYTTGIFIGPEGGYESSEVEFARNNKIISVSLGRRILRTETAGIALLSMMMLYIEK